MEIDENEDTFLDDSEDTGDNDCEPKIQQETIDEEEQDNNSGLLSYSIAMCME